MKFKNIVKIIFFNNFLTLIVLIFFLMLIGYVSVIFLGGNNEIEEISEAIIEKEIGVHVDLTPE